MSVLVLALFFILLAVGVFFMAMSGGPKRKRKQPYSTTRRNRRLGMGAFLLALLGLGIGIPAAVIGAVESRNSIPEANVSVLSAPEKQGRKLFGQHCKNCHALSASNAVAQVGPSLDQLRPPKALVVDAISNGRARGNGQMAADLVEGRDVQDVAAYVAKATGSAK
ncbi:MAG: cytochrome c [Solirubrobacterales bacterium]|jgi:mono/diheme cytochrome c family protein|nr:cytochrome c [Solirubrobacterales bacterium]